MEFLGVDFRTIILAIITVVNFMLGLLLYLRARERSTLFFVITVMGAGIWTFGINLYINEPTVSNLTYLWSTINYLVATIIAVAFFFFALLFGAERVRFNKWVTALIIIALLVIDILVISPFDLLGRPVVTAIVDAGSVRIDHFGWGFIPYVLFLLVFFFGGMGILIEKFFKSTGRLHDQLKFILIGTALAIFTGLTANIFLPAVFGYPNSVWMGPVGSIIMVGFITYAITKHHLWNFRIVTSEIFSALIILVLFIDFFIVESLAQQLIKGGVLVTIAAFSFFLIKGILREIETREQLNHLAARIRKTNDRLREIDAEKSDFVSITAHQFRTPLTVIKGYTSMLLEGSFGHVRDKRQHTAVEKMYQASQRLVLLIDEFLNINRIERNEMRYNFEVVDVRELLSGVIRYLEPAFRQENLRFNLEADQGDTYLIHGDEEKLRQVFSVVIDNAIKYTPQGGAIRAAVERDRRKGVIRVTVKDTGIGISNDMMPRLFEKFSRSRDVSKLHAEGRGLGLFIARQIMMAHGGRIWAVSEGLNKGSTFHIELTDVVHEEKRKEIKEFIENL